MTKEPLELLGEYGAQVDAPAKAFLSRSEDGMYGMMRYFMGYADEHFSEKSHPVGKRIRPGLLLCIADSYGVLEKAVPAALSIELFHNFTLIHDDIVDRDELRRGRPTVWKIWGVDHAINTGDAQLILSLAALSSGKAEAPSELTNLLLTRYLEVIEGQYLDFTLAATRLDDPSVTEERYLTMLDHKTAKLIRAATETPAIIAKRGTEEVAALGDFGEKLGMAYQLFDDWQSIWGAQEKTGKRAAGDIYERKKTLPVIHARERLTGTDRTRLISLYGKDILQEADVDEVLSLFEKAGAKEALEQRAAAYKEAALGALSASGLSQETKEILEKAAAALVPDSVIASR